LTVGRKLSLTTATLMPRRYVPLDRRPATPA
jgi:hypothetical protein